MNLVICNDGRGGTADGLVLVQQKNGLRDGMTIIPPPETPPRTSNNNNKGCRGGGRGHWKPHEDAKLKELVSELGPQNWNLIAQKLQGRSGKSCRLRWYNQLDPRIKKRGFEAEEEEKLLGAQRMYGNRWAFIARAFPGRTDNALKNQWHVIMARLNRQHQPKRRTIRINSTTQTNHPLLFSSPISPTSIISSNHQLIMNPFHQQQDYCIEEEPKMVVGVRRKEIIIKNYQSADSSSSSSSSSQVISASDQYNYSGATNMFVCGPEYQKNVVGFIDFLGLGST